MDSTVAPGARAAWMMRASCFIEAIERRLHGVDLVDRHDDGTVAVGMDEVTAFRRHAVDGDRNSEIDHVHVGV